MSHPKGGKGASDCHMVVRRCVRRSTQGCFPYLEHAAGVVHGRLVSTSHSALANKLCLSQLVV